MRRKTRVVRPAAGWPVRGVACALTRPMPLTTSHPDGVCQVVSSTIVPGMYRRWSGTNVLNGPNRKLPEFVCCPICEVDFRRDLLRQRWCSPECSQLGKRRADGTQRRNADTSR